MAARIRAFFDSLFTSRLVLHLEAEIQRLEREKEQLRIDYARLQAQFYAVTPAGIMAARQNTPKPTQSAPAGPKRWNQVVAEHLDRMNKEIASEQKVPESRNAETSRQIEDQRVQ